MEIIGLTGGIGSGKSEVCRYLKQKYNAEIIMADDVGHEVMEPGTRCIEELHKIFSDECFYEDGRLNRKVAGSIAFENPEILQRMNEIIHPAVWDAIQERLIEAEKSGKQIAVIEAALLIGTSYRKICSEFWYIYTSEPVRIKRLIASRDISEEKAKKIMESQLSEEEFRESCDFTADNNGDFSETAAQIDAHIAKRYSL